MEELRMNKVEKQRVLDVLNSLEVIEQQGGEDAYMLVDNTEENRKRLNEVGVSDEIINGYGDENAFCILALAFGENYADEFVGGKFIKYMWMVYDNENGLVGVFDEYDEALSKYEKCKATCEDWVHEDGEFSTDETVILAKVEKYLYSYDTGDPVKEENENGEEVNTGDTYWDFKEIAY